VNFFNEHATLLLGKPASELAELQEQQQHGELERIFGEAQFRMWRFRLLAKRDEYNGKTRIKTSCIGVEKPDLSQLNEQLVAKLQLHYNIQVPAQNDTYDLSALLPQPQL